MAAYCAVATGTFVSNIMFQVHGCWIIYDGRSVSGERRHFSSVGFA